MAITDEQRAICRLLAHARVERGESYVAGGVALNELLGGARVSRDVDLFHDTREALAASWEADRTLLEGAGYDVDPIRERPTFVEAIVRRAGATVDLQWICDSAFRFFPLVEDDDFGLVLHPFDLATNKVLALVGRLEPRDWVDTIVCSQQLQPLGFLAWAACGKDPGYGPAHILAEAARSGRYAPAELNGLEFDGPAPSAAELSATWHRLLRDAEAIIESLPPRVVGRCVLTADNELFRGDAAATERAVAEGSLRYHSGRIGGALPTLRSPSS